MATQVNRLGNQDIRNGYQLGPEPLRWLGNPNNLDMPTVRDWYSQHPELGVYDGSNEMNGAWMQDQMRHYDPNAQWIPGTTEQTPGSEGASERNIPGHLQYDESRLPHMIGGANTIVNNGQHFGNSNNVIYDPNYGWVSHTSNVRNPKDWLDYGPAVVLAAASLGSALPAMGVMGGATGGAAAGTLTAGQAAGAVSGMHAIASGHPAGAIGAGLSMLGVPGGNLIGSAANAALTRPQNSGIRQQPTQSPLLSRVATPSNNTASGPRVGSPLLSRVSQPSTRQQQYTPTQQSYLNFVRNYRG